MTREEIIKIFEENHIAKGNATINATKLAEIFTKHEADLLKEFVEWEGEEIKRNLVGVSKESEALVYEIIAWFDSDLKKFLEERK